MYGHSKSAAAGMRGLSVAAANDADHAAFLEHEVCRISESSMMLLCTYILTACIIQAKVTPCKHLPALLSLLRVQGMDLIPPRYVS